MPTTIPLAFQRLRENLEITGLQKSTVSTRQTNVREAIEKDLRTVDSFLTGSYSRHTLIAPLSEADIDIMIILNVDYYYDYNAVSLLNKVRKVLKQTYTKTPRISDNGQAVTITFTDFKVDVIPAFYRKGTGYLIPDSHKKVWLETDPTIHIEKVNNANAKHEYKLVPIIKMIKGWNKNIGSVFSPFYLEMLAIEIFDGVTISNFPSGIRYFFDKGREKIKYKVSDPAGFGGEINGFTGISTVDKATSRFEMEYNKALYAEKYDQNGDTKHAFTQWRKIFRDYFPAYG